jgi:hypothetical protein
MAERTWNAIAAQRGQATVELVAGLPVLLLAGLIAFQLLAVGFTVAVSDGAAEAAAIALASGEPAEEAARSALPGWARSDVEVKRNGGRVEVRVDPPALIPALGEQLEVSSSAWIQRPDR